MRPLFLAGQHVSQAKHIRRAAIKMADLPQVPVNYLKLAREQMNFARFCHDKNR